MKIQFIWNLVDEQCLIKQEINKKVLSKTVNYVLKGLC